MVKENNLIIENKKAQVGEVREINNEIPSFEEFVKNYEGGINYGDLSYSDISLGRGCGPCSGCSNSELTFELEIILKNSRGGWKKYTTYRVDCAREIASEISRNVEFWSDSDRRKFTAKERSSLVSKINDAVNEHINNYKNINRVVESDVDSSNNGNNDACCNSIM